MNSAVDELIHSRLSYDERSGTPVATEYRLLGSTTRVHDSSTQTLTPEETAVPMLPCSELLLLLTNPLVYPGLIQSFRLANLRGCRGGCLSYVAQALLLFS